MEERDKKSTLIVSLYLYFSQFFHGIFFLMSTNSQSTNYLDFSITQFTLKVFAISTIWILQKVETQF